MLSIIVLVLLCSAINNEAKKKGRKSGRFLFWTLLLWGGMQFVGGFVGGAIAIYAQWNMDLLVGVMGWIFAIMGAIISFQIVKHAKPGEHIPPEPQPQTLHQPGNTQNDVAWQPPQKDASVQLGKKSDSIDEVRIVKGRSISNGSLQRRRRSI